VEEVTNAIVSSGIMGHSIGRMEEGLGEEKWAAISAAAT
jgi:hypothetical protein